MQIDLKVGRLGTERDATLIIGLFEGAKLDNNDRSGMALPLRRYLQEFLSLGDFKGQDEEISVLYPRGTAPPRRVILVGLGKPSSFNLDKARRASGVAIRRVLQLGVSKITTSIHSPGPEGQDVHPDYAQATVEGLLLGAYKYDTYKTEVPHGSELESVTMVVLRRAQANKIKAGIEVGQITAAGTIMARDLSNAPGNDLPPRKLAAAARIMASKNGLHLSLIHI